MSEVVTFRQGPNRIGILEGGRKGRKGRLSDQLVWCLGSYLQSKYSKIAGSLGENQMSLQTWTLHCNVLVIG